MAKILLHGTEAICEGAIRNGCRAFFGYPITPQNEVPEYMSVKMPEIGGVFVQAESEIAAINMVYGAAGSGVRSMTSSSSPGISLKQEGISYIACAKIPCVIVNIMRAGPGLGGILPAQGDYFQAVKGGRPRRLPPHRARARVRAGGVRSHVSRVRSVGQVPRARHDLRRRHDRPVDGTVELPPMRALSDIPEKNWATDGAFGEKRAYSIPF